ncbi:MAG: hypothetical protein WA821_00105 [Anaerolineales bacterium]
MKFTRLLFLLVVFAITDITTMNLLRRAYPVAYTLTGGSEIGRLIYTLLLFSIGCWLASYIFRMSQAKNLKQILLFSSMAGIGAGTIMTALIQAAMFLL